MRDDRRPSSAGEGCRNYGDGGYSMKRLWLILLLAVPAMAQTTIFNCSTTWGTAPCDFNASPYPTPSATFFNVNGTTGSTSTSVQLVPASGGHASWGLVYSNPVNDQ